MVFSGGGKALRIYTQKACLLTPSGNTPQVGPFPGLLNKVNRSTLDWRPSMGTTEETRKVKGNYTLHVSVMLCLINPRFSELGLARKLSRKGDIAY